MEILASVFTVSPNFFRTTHVFMINILKLLCSIFCTFILFSYVNFCIELCDESHLRATVYNLPKIGF